MNKLHRFSSPIPSVELPKEFDYPHNYTPHPLAILAAKELQNYLATQTDFNHDFGLTYNNESALGKMFGVLVVKDTHENLGYLAAFSGKLANTNLHTHFVPPVFDILNPDGFYVQTELKLNAITAQISALINDTAYIQLQKKYMHQKETFKLLLEEEQLKIKKRRKLRKEQGITDNQKNINEEFYLKEYAIYLSNKMQPLQEAYTAVQKKIDLLKKQRTEISATVQQKIFEHYVFLNSKQQTQNLLTLFNNNPQNIPAGAGDCCAPKLLQYAFNHQLTPIAMAEFWWGKPLPTAIRKHLQYYPACTGKCKPILEFMLQGLPVAQNPLLSELQYPKELPVLFEDEHLVAINKPAEFLSVTGKESTYTVESIMRTKYPEATGPLIVHRLDMSTSGILIVAKTKEIHKRLQEQFIKKTIQKRYIALLNGVLSQKKGIIELPLRVDLEDRPKQLVCFEHGKKAITHWEVINIQNQQTKVYMYPITGRTHQLRVHAAHNLGLNIPIVGDDLYGTKSTRLHLHAEQLMFTHPVTKQQITITAPCPF
ncbi:RluA family pseudouridine synthase [Tenacibaculum sp. TC6]|uniref:RluA family pseudouridine synthase n=1 Tax=Tenacibaculum sp. TC6 TaxID=3423223 RepID=UPI003D36D1D7